MIFATPDDFLGRTLELAGEMRSGPEVATAIGRALGRPLTYAAFPDGSLRDNPVFERVVAAATKLRVDIDLALLRTLHPGLQTCASWLERGGAARIAPFVG